VDVKVGRKYTCDLWKGMFYMTIIEVQDDKVKGNVYSYDKIVDIEQEWSIYNFDKDLSPVNFYPLFKKVKNTALARKMYPEAEIEEEWLIVYE
jgi:hypothetical protein